jgi:hypothetical protein
MQGSLGTQVSISNEMALGLPKVNLMGEESIIEWSPRAALTTAIQQVINTTGSYYHVSKSRIC